MKSLTVFTALALLAAAGTVSAQSRSDDTRTREGDVFRSHELSFDLFGSVSVGQETIDGLSGERVVDDGRLGAGAGVNYYFTPYLGFGADLYTENTDDHVVDNGSANLLLRLPFESIRLAPYVYGGGGRQFDPQERWFGQFGGGLDIRVTRHWGLFTDVRYVMVDAASNFGVGRLGVRIPF